MEFCRPPSRRYDTVYECFASGSGGCGGNPGLIYASELRVNEADEPMRSVEYTIGVGITGSMSGNVGNPWVATRLPGGPNNNKSVVLVEVALDEGGSFLTPPPGVWRFRHENQQRSLIGMTDLDGLPTAEVDYNEYGLAYLKDVLWVPDQSVLDSAENGEVEPWGDVVVLEVDVGLSDSDLIGAMARVVNPTTAPHVVTGRIVALVAGTPDVVYIEDPDGDFLGAINAGGLVTVFAHYDATLNGSQVHTSGRWTTAPAHVSGTTTFTASGSVFEDYIVGWQIQPDARYPVYFEITGVDGAEITVRGDLESQVPNLESEAVHYILIPPVGIDRTTGAIDTAPTAPATRYLAFGYHYIPPVAGVSIDDTTFGAQPGPNLAGTYYCWNRFFQAGTGRWMTADPAEVPSTNLSSYSNEHPNYSTDPSGLMTGWTFDGIKDRSQKLQARGEGWEFKWMMTVDANHKAQGYYPFQRVTSKITYECCDAKSFIFITDYLQVFNDNGKQITDTQWSQNLARDVGRPACKLAGGKDIARITESRVNVVFLGKLSGAAQNEFRQRGGPPQLFVDVGAATAARVGAATTTAVFHSLVPADRKFKHMGTNFTDIFVAKSDIAGSKMQYNIAFQSTFDCKEVPSRFVSSQIKVTSAQEKKIEWSATSP